MGIHKLIFLWASLEDVEQDQYGNNQLILELLAETCMLSGFPFKHSDLVIEFA